MPRSGRRNAKNVKVGDTYGRWTVVGPPTKHADGSSVFPLVCECGNEGSVKFRYLNQDHPLSTKSCGCLQKESATETFTKHGKYENNTYKTKKGRREQWLWKTYGLTQDEYDSMYDKQLGRCAICLTTFGEQELFVDHDHGSGAVRGLLCRHCNLAIGYLMDDVDACKRAAAYLEEAAKIEDTATTLIVVND